MTVDNFLCALVAELEARGIEHAVAKKHSVSLVRTFTEEDIREITEYSSPADFSDLADSFSNLIVEKEESNFKSSEANDMAKTRCDVPISILLEPISEENPAEAKTQAFSVLNADEDLQKTRVGDLIGAPSFEKTVISAVEDGATQEIGIEIAEENAVEEEEIQKESAPALSPIKEKTVLTKRGRAIFTTITVLTAPLWICAAVLIFAFFGLLIVAVCAMIAAALVLVCLEAAAGCAAALVGVIYGAGQMFSGNLAVGLFEMGIGVALGGLMLALCILTYNFAVRVMPSLLKHVIAFEGYCLRRIPPVLDGFREECNKL